jgi:hypothetical protein
MQLPDIKVCYCTADHIIDMNSNTQKLFFSVDLSNRGKKHSEDLGVDGKIILELILGQQSERGVDWMQLGQDRDK